MEKGYDTAQICLNGHVISQMAVSYPDQRQPFCEKCGEPTVMECPDCGAAIRGHYHVPGVVGGFDYDRPGFCHNCGEPYPWTKRAKKAAAQLASQDESLSDDEVGAFENDVDKIIRDTPQAKASAGRVKKLLSKMASRTASEVREIIVDIASESAKKIILADR